MCSLVAAIILISLITTAAFSQSASQPLVLEVAGTLGLQEFQKTWIGTIGLFIEMGALQGFQLRFAVSTGLFNSIVFTQLESIFILNFAQKFYAGAGLGVPMIIGSPQSGLPLNLVVLVGVKSPITPTFLAQIEGGVTLPTNTSGGPSLRGSLVGIIPF